MITGNRKTYLEAVNKFEINERKELAKANKEYDKELKKEKKEYSKIEHKLTSGGKARKSYSSGFARMEVKRVKVL